MGEPGAVIGGDLSEDQFEQIVRVCDDFEARLRRGEMPRIDEFIQGNPTLPGPALFRELLALELELARPVGSVAKADYAARFPEWIPEVEDVFAENGPGAACEASRPVTVNGRVADCEEKPASPLPIRIGRYTVLSLLDQGGQSRVFRVMHPDLRKELVLKLAGRRVSSDPSSRELLVAEARILAGLEHPNLVRVYDLDTDEHGVPFVVLDYVAGRRLDRLVEEGLPSPRQAAEMVAEIARTVAYIHSRDVVHQDIKPRNILLDEKRRPHLIDFGLARLRSAWADEGQGPSGGTLAFMAPEQTRGDLARVGPWTDIFALGGVLYFMLTGKAPFAGQSRQEQVLKVESCDFDRAAVLRRGIPRRLARIVLKAMAADPSQRHSSASALADDLTAFVRGTRGPALILGSLLMLGAVLAPGVAMVMRQQTSAENQGRATVPAEPPPNNKVPAIVSAPLRIEELRVVIHSRTKDGDEPRELGRAVFEGRTEDLMSVSARLSEPAYCYVIALHPNGKSQSYYPDEDPWGLYKVIVVPSERNGNTIPDSGKELVVVANVGGVLRIRVFDAAGTMVVGMGEGGWPTKVAQVADLKKLVEHVPSAHEPSKTEKKRIIDLVTSIAGDSLKVPALKARIRAPEDGGFELADGTGLQALVLVVSWQPLPEYAQWSQRIGSLPWKKTEADGVWRFDGEEFRPEFAVEHERGPKRPLPDRAPPVLVETVRFLQMQPGIDAIQAVAFPVRPVPNAGRG
jgi:predicted Ser/Thr protein kinase